MCFAVRPSKCVRVCVHVCVYVCEPFLCFLSRRNSATFSRNINRIAPPSQHRLLSPKWLCLSVCLCGPSRSTFRGLHFDGPGSRFASCPARQEIGAGPPAVLAQEELPTKPCMLTNYHLAISRFPFSFWRCLYRCCMSVVLLPYELSFLCHFEG